MAGSVRQAANIRHLSVDANMRLDALTLRNLDVLENHATGQLKGSLLWLLLHTRTPCGARLLKRWVAKPLLQLEVLEQRLDAVSELAGHSVAQGGSGEQAQSAWVGRLKALLQGLPDLERCLADRKSVV